MRYLFYIHYLYIILLGKAVTSLSCNDGYFLDSNSGCEKCPDHCQFCESKEHCLSCENGYWGNVCERVCSACKDETSCEKLNGFCLEDCKDGFTGVLCDAKCSIKCLSCSRTDVQICSSCAVGRYSLVSCNKSCPSSCYNKKCNATGFCTFGCEKGTWGQKCEKSCTEFCKDNSCSQDNGTCIFGCEDRYTGAICDIVERGEEFNTTVVVVVPIVATLIILALVVTLFLRLAKKGKCTRARFSRVQKSDTRRHRKTENPDEVEELNIEATAKTENEVSKEPIIVKKAEANEHIENTATSSETNQRQRAADMIYRFKILLCCVSGRRSQTPEDLSIAAHKATISKAPEEEKKTREEKLQAFVTSIKNKTDQDLRREFSQLPVPMQKSDATSLKKENRSDIEKEGIFPYDENRVIIHDNRGKELYVNASHIKDMSDKPYAYIACEGPRKEDGHKRMWKLLSKYSCKTIVMFNTIVEFQKTEERYWPVESKSYDAMCVTFTSKKDIDKNCIARQFCMKEGSKVRLVNHFQYTDWPEKGVPTNVQSLVAFLETVKLAQRKEREPLVVHGRCGVGRTGTFIALHMLSKEVEEIVNGNDKTEIDIYSCVEKLRKQRINMVENLEQYKFLHEALSCYFEKRLESKRVQQTGEVGTAKEETSVLIQ